MAAMRWQRLCQRAQESELNLRMSSPGFRMKCLKLAPSRVGGELLGPTLTKGFETINYFKFGIYLCCTDDVAKIRGTHLYFAAGKRAATREELNTGCGRWTRVGYYRNNDMGFQLLLNSM
jgi:hypothetical protein